MDVFCKSSHASIIVHMLRGGTAFFSHASALSVGLSVL